MRAFLSALAIAAGLLCFGLTAQAQSSDSVARDTAAGPTYIIHVTVIDAENGKESPDQTVIVSGDRILEVKDMPPHHQR